MTVQTIHVKMEVNVRTRIMALNATAQLALKVTDVRQVRRSLFILQSCNIYLSLVGTAKLVITKFMVLLVQRESKEHQLV